MELRGVMSSASSAQVHVLNLLGEVPTCLGGLHKPCLLGFMEWLTLLVRDDVSGPCKR